MKFVNSVPAPMDEEASALVASHHDLSVAQQEIERLKSGFVSTLVRDVRLPLAGILGLLELFESKLQAREPFDLEDRQLLNSAIEQGDRMRHLMDNLLELAQGRERPLNLEFETVSVKHLLEEIAEPLRGEAALRGVELNVYIIDGSLRMQVDARQTRRAVCHLLSAALAATPDGGSINIEAQAIAGARLGDEAKRLVVINVADSGAGIPAEEVPFIFDAFWQAADAYRSPGRGVGLAIARRIAASHGGNVSVRSQVGSGTTYSIVLPINIEEVSIDRRRILIVDDVPEILLLQRKLVARMGYEVEIAADGRAALAVLEKCAVDLLITDWAMPGMNGGELIAAIKEDERFRSIPIIVLTGHDTDTERDEAEAVGCNRFLVKPFKRDALQRVINELLPAQEVRNQESGTRM